MRVTSVAVRRLQLELVAPLSTAVETHHARPLLIVAVSTDSGPGIGECEALATSGYSGESVESAAHALIHDLAPSVLAAGEVEGASALASDVLTRRSSMASAALEMALLDAELRARDSTLASWLAVSRKAIPAGATIGLGDLPSICRAAKRADASGFARIKLKVCPGRDLEALRAVRGEVPTALVTADANGSYDLAKRQHRLALEEIDDLGLAAIEQPLSAGDWRGLAELTNELSTPVLLDESIATLEDVERALDEGAGRALVIKPARLGGIVAARRARDRCVAAGVGLAIGGLFEAGIGRAASIAVGAMRGFDFPGDLGPSDRYFAEDITPPHEMRHGSLAVPSGPGLGVEPRWDVIDRLTSRKWTIDRS